MFRNTSIQNAINQIMDATEYVVTERHYLILARRELPTGDLLISEIHDCPLKDTF